MSRVPRSVFFLLFTVSGFAGLIYESIWSHYLKLFLGHAAYAQRSEERRVGKECRSRCDWSSDVCSSDLRIFPALYRVRVRGAHLRVDLEPLSQALSGPRGVRAEIGRASCRERV